MGRLVSRCCLTCLPTWYACCRFHCRELLLLCIDHRLPSVLQVGHVPMQILKSIDTVASYFEPLAVEQNPKLPHCDMCH